MTEFIWQNQLFSRPDANVFVVLDGAKVRGLLNQLEETQPEYGCLYRGELIPELAEAVPYLVRLERGSEFLEWESNGVFLRWRRRICEQCVSIFGGC